MTTGVHCLYPASHLLTTKLNATTPNLTTTKSETANIPKKVIPKLGSILRTNHYFSMCTGTAYHSMRLLVKRLLLTVSMGQVQSREVPEIVLSSTM